MSKRELLRVINNPIDFIKRLFMTIALAETNAAMRFYIEKQRERICREYQERKIENSPGVE